MAKPDAPYQHPQDETLYEIGRGVSWLVCAFFLLLLWLPALTEHVSKALAGKWSQTTAAHLLGWRPSQGSIVDHLHAVEKDLDRSNYSTEIRRRTQQWLTRDLWEGTSKVLIGYDGWLFYEPDIKALTGYGPMKPEPYSVMKDPELATLPETRDVVASFAAQLKERGVSLLLLPLPLKPMIYPEVITGLPEVSGISHPDAPAFYQWLRSRGVDVLDLTEDLAVLRGQRKYVFRREPAKHDRTVEEQEDKRMEKTMDVFLLQDTHWTPDAMRHAAEKVAAYVKEKYPRALHPGVQEIRAVDGVTRSSLGDLVKLLDLKNPEELFDAESAFLRVIGDGTQNRTSPIVLLGDSFVNVFDDPSLGFENPAKPGDTIHAGFAQQLSLLLNQPLDVIAMNGKGSTGVRREFAGRHDDEVRGKKLVIWAIAARDLLLSKTAAHAANIEWAPVAFNPSRASPAAASSGQEANKVIIDARLVEKSRNQSLDSPYRNALHTALYDVEKVIAGKLDAKQVLGVQWTFQEKQMAPTAGFTAGNRYRLTLTPWDKKPEAMRLINLQDDTTAFDVEKWFIEKAELVK